MLMTFNGNLPGVPELAVGQEFTLPPPPTDDALSRAQNLPGTVVPRTKVTPPPPPQDDTQSPY
jgi:hypothetical protein